MIDMHVSNLTWARIMLAIFYEQGRASRVDDGAGGGVLSKGARYELRR